ncbi:MAG: ATP-binding protein [Paludibacteraceae bacterium]|nr:ATP-binding protein [Paludibacteraceae bacterium]
MQIVDRKDEQKRLRRVLQESSSSVFVAIYGRRRIGKSTLVKLVLNDEDVYFMADKSEQPVQRELLAMALSDSFPDFDAVKYPSWDALFTSLNHRANRRFTLCLDEFPFLVSQSPELPSVLQRLIDSNTLKFNIIICGSSQQMMEKAILDSSEPLYGRATSIIKLLPLRLPYIQEALGLTDVQAIEEYAVWGGVPRYWILRETESSLFSALEYHLLNVNGTLYDEPNLLFLDDMTQSTQAQSLLSVIGNGCNRLSEIAARMEKKATDLSRPLKKLIDLGYLYKEIPFGEKEENSKKSLYKIADPFMSFYFAYVVPNRSLIGMGRGQAVLRKLEASFSEYVSFWWEHFCMQAVSGQELFGRVWGMASRWWGNGFDEMAKKSTPIEIDVVAESDDKSLLIGECKWTEGEYAERLFNELRQKANLLPLAKKRHLEFVLFLKSPILDSNFSLPSDCHLFYPKDVINIMF